MDGEGTWQRMKLYTHYDPAALYRAEKAAWQQMKLHEADPDAVPSSTAMSHMGGVSKSMWRS